MPMKRVGTVFAIICFSFDPPVGIFTYDCSSLISAYSAVRYGTQASFDIQKMDQN